jgi:carbamoyltransferase
MLLVAPVAPAKRTPPHERGETARGLDKLAVVRSEIPAVTHVDCSARVQTVDGRNNPLFHALLTRFEGLTGCPMVINTSFNVRGEPIVCSAEEAYACFMRTAMDDLVLGSYLLTKEEQPDRPIEEPVPHALD